MKKLTQEELTPEQNRKRSEGIECAFLTVMAILVAGMLCTIVPDHPLIRAETVITAAICVGCLVVNINDIWRVGYVNKTDERNSLILYTFISIVYLVMTIDDIINGKLLTKNDILLCVFLGAFCFIWINMVIKKLTDMKKEKDQSKKRKA